MDNYLATWYFREDEELGHKYCQVSGQAGTDAFNTIYWRCVYCFYKTSLLTQKNIKYYFFTNTEVPENVEGFNLKHFMDDNEIHIIKLEYTYMPPMNWCDEWWAELFEFDILKYCGDIAGNWLVLDSDCILRKSLKPVYELIQKDGAISYQRDYALNHDINGLTIKGEREIYEMVFGERADDLQHLGAEFIGIRSDRIGEMLSIYDILWKYSLSRFLEGKSRLITEEHFFSLIYYKMGIRYAKGGGVYKTYVEC